MFSAPEGNENVGLSPEIRRCGPPRPVSGVLLTKMFDPSRRLASPLAHLAVMTENPDEHDLGPALRHQLQL